MSAVTTVEFRTLKTQRSARRKLTTVAFKLVFMDHLHKIIIKKAYKG